MEISASGKDGIDGESSLVEGMFPQPGLQVFSLKYILVHISEAEGS